MQKLLIQCLNLEQELMQSLEMAMPPVVKTEIIIILIHQKDIPARTISYEIEDFHFLFQRQEKIQNLLILIAEQTNAPSVLKNAVV